jgi:hypothetical protein
MIGIHPRKRIGTLLTTKIRRDAISEAWRRLATLTYCDSHRPPGMLLLALRL